METKTRTEERTTIELKRSTVAVLQALGKKGETYDDVVARLIVVAKKAGVFCVRG